MSRFADPRAVQEIDLGPCECPGAPHERDIAVIRSDYSDTDAALLRASTVDVETGAAEFAKHIVSWNLLGPNGEPWPPSAESVMALKAPTLTPIAEAIARAVNESNQLPNRSGAPSAASSRGSASRTPATTPAPGT